MSFNFARKKIHQTLTFTNAFRTFTETKKWMKAQLNGFVIRYSSVATAVCVTSRDPGGLEHKKNTCSSVVEIADDRDYVLIECYVTKRFLSPTVVIGSLFLLDFL